MGLERHWKFCKLMKLRRWCSGKETNFSTASKVLWTEEPGRLYPWGQKALDTTEHARTHRPANNGPPKLNPLSKVMHQHKFLLLQPEFVLRKKNNMALAEIQWRKQNKHIYWNYCNFRHQTSSLS